MKILLAYILFGISMTALAGVVIPERDNDGGILYGQRITHPGWQYQLTSFEITTCKLGGKTELGVDGLDQGFGVLKWYDGSGTELVQGGSETDADFQIRLDTDCKKTHMDWTPTTDYQLIGGQIRQQNAPSTNVRLWVIGVPGLTPAQGGTKVFINNLNLKFLANAESVTANGRAPKDLLYNNPIPGTNTLRYQFISDSLGLQHTTQVSMEIFMP